MIDRDRLREALATLDRYDFTCKDIDSRSLAIAVEAARLVASDDTLIVEKVNGEWPAPFDELWTYSHHELPEKGGKSVMKLIDLDALLAQQTGDTK